MGELLTHLQGKGEEACREFYRALHLHVEEVYYSLPTRLRLRGLATWTASIYAYFDIVAFISCSIIHDEIQIPGVSVLSPNGLDPLKYQQDCPQRYVLNDRGEKNLLGCSITCLIGVQKINLTTSVISPLPFKRILLPLTRSCLLHGLLQHCSGNGLTLLLQWYCSFSVVTCNLLCNTTPMHRCMCFLNKVFMRCVLSAEEKLTGGSRALGIAALGLKRKAEEVLIWYTEESLMK